jgi:hypothetical protein
VNLSQYADDIAVWATGNNQNHIQKIVQNYLNKLTDWCNNWFIKINPEKTQVVCFTRQRKNIDIKLQLLNQDLPISTEATFLGVIFDKKLTWSAHAAKITKSIWQKCNVLRSLTGRDWGAKGDFLVKLFKQWALPNLSYGCLSFSNMKKSHFRKIEVIQNTLIRSAYRKPRDTRVAELLEIANLKPIAEFLIDNSNKELNRIKSDSNLLKTLHLWKHLAGRKKQAHNSPLDSINNYSHINL